jgi:pimeloyl-ACP methyl ester carboxylesterase
LGDAKFLFYDLQVRERIDSAQKRGRRVVIAGHSLGAATAIELAAIAESESSQPITAVVALCAPRSADSEHAKRLASRLGNRLLRVINSRDFVCMVPPAWFGFRHVGQTHYFDRNGNYHPALTAGFRAADLFAACFADACKGRFFRDLLGYHSAVRVVQLLSESIERFNLKVKND